VRADQPGYEDEIIVELGHLCNRNGNHGNAGRFRSETGASPRRPAVGRRQVRIAALHHISVIGRDRCCLGSDAGVWKFSAAAGSLNRFTVI
jgi:hypothetical protein